MFNINPYALGGAFVGGLVGTYFLSLLFRYALLGRNGTKVQQLWVIMLTGVVGIGFSAFGDGTGGFTNRITNMPDMTMVIAYGLSALIIAFTVSRNFEEPTVKRQLKMGGILGRAVALVFVVPMTLIGIGNLTGNAYSFAVNGPPPGPGLGASRAEMRQIMLDGEMAPFWAMVDEKAPEDLYWIIESLFAAEDTYRSADDVAAKFNNEMLKYRVSLAIYGPALTDTQRRVVIQNQTDFIREFQGDPETCAMVAISGGAGLSQEQLLSVKEIFNRTLVETMGLLIDARNASRDGVMMPSAPTEDDYLLLTESIFESGFTEDQLMAFANGDTTHPEFCNMAIGFMDAIARIEGQAGERIRFEATQEMLTTVPQ